MKYEISDEEARSFEETWKIIKAGAITGVLMGILFWICYVLSQGNWGSI